MNHDLYGFYGVSVWMVRPDSPLTQLERTKLVKFDRYAEFNVADLVARGLELWATGVHPHYDVVCQGGRELDGLIALFAAAPHQIHSNPHVDREET